MSAAKTSSSGSGSSVSHSDFEPLSGFDQELTYELRTADDYNILKTNPHYKRRITRTAIAGSSTAQELVECISDYFGTQLATLIIEQIPTPETLAKIAADTAIPSKEEVVLNEVKKAIKNVSALINAHSSRTSLTSIPQPKGEFQLPFKDLGPLVAQRLLVQPSNFYGDTLARLLLGPLYGHLMNRIPISHFLYHGLINYVTSYVSSDGELRDLDFLSRFPLVWDVEGAAYMHWVENKFQDESVRAAHLWACRYARWDAITGSNLRNLIQLNTFTHVSRYLPSFGEKAITDLEVVDLMTPLVFETQRLKSILNKRHVLDGLITQETRWHLSHGSLGESRFRINDDTHAQAIRDLHTQVARRLSEYFVAESNYSNFVDTGLDTKIMNASSFGAIVATVLLFELWDAFVKCGHTLHQLRTRLRGESAVSPIRAELEKFKYKLRALIGKAFRSLETVIKCPDGHGLVTAQFGDPDNMLLSPLPQLTEETLINDIIQTLVQPRLRRREDHAVVTRLSQQLSDLQLLYLRRDPEFARDPDTLSIMTMNRAQFLRGEGYESLLMDTLDPFSGASLAKEAVAWNISRLFEVVSYLNQSWGGLKRARFIRRGLKSVSSMPSPKVMMMMMLVGAKGDGENGDGEEDGDGDGDGNNKKKRERGDEEEGGAQQPPPPKLKKKKKTSAESLEGGVFSSSVLLQFSDRLKVIKKLREEGNDERLDEYDLPIPKTYKESELMMTAYRLAYAISITWGVAQTGHDDNHLIAPEKWESLGNAQLLTPANRSTTPASRFGRNSEDLKYLLDELAPICAVMLKAAHTLAYYFSVNSICQVMLEPCMQSLGYQLDQKLRILDTAKGTAIWSKMWQSNVNVDRLRVHRLIYMLSSNLEFFMNLQHDNYTTMSVLVIMIYSAVKFNDDEGRITYQSQGMVLGDLYSVDYKRLAGENTLRDNTTNLFIASLAVQSEENRHHFENTIELNVLNSRNGSVKQYISKNDASDDDDHLPPTPKSVNYNVTALRRYYSDISSGVGGVIIQVGQHHVRTLDPLWSYTSLWPHYLTPVTCVSARLLGIRANYGVADKTMDPVEWNMITLKMNYLNYQASLRKRLDFTDQTQEFKGIMFEVDGIKVSHEPYHFGIPVASQARTDKMFNMMLDKEFVNSVSRGFKNAAPRRANKAIMHDNTEVVPTVKPEEYEEDLGSVAIDDMNNPFRNVTVVKGALRKFCEVQNLNVEEVALDKHYKVYLKSTYQYLSKYPLRIAGYTNVTVEEEAEDWKPRMSVNFEKVSYDYGHASKSESLLKGWRPPALPKDKKKLYEQNVSDPTLIPTLAEETPEEKVARERADLLTPYGKGEVNSYKIRPKSKLPRDLADEVASAVIAKRDKQLWGDYSKEEVREAEVEAVSPSSSSAKVAMPREKRKEKKEKRKEKTGDRPSSRKSKKKEERRERLMGDTIQTYSEDEKEKEKPAGEQANEEWSDGDDDNDELPDTDAVEENQEAEEGEMEDNDNDEEEEAEEEEEQPISQPVTPRDNYHNQAVEEILQALGQGNEEEEEEDNDEQSISLPETPKGNLFEDEEENNEDDPLSLLVGRKNEGKK